VQGVGAACRLANAAAISPTRPANQSGMALASTIVGVSGMFRVGSGRPARRRSTGGGVLIP